MKTLALPMIIVILVASGGDDWLVMVMRDGSRLRDQDV
jgi:hypothetical protein